MRELQKNKTLVFCGVLLALFLSLGVSYGQGRDIIIVEKGRIGHDDITFQRPKEFEVEPPKKAEPLTIRPLNVSDPPTKGPWWNGLDRGVEVCVMPYEVEIVPHMEQEVDITLYEVEVEVTPHGVEVEVPPYEVEVYYLLGHTLGGFLCNRGNSENITPYEVTEVRPDNFVDIFRAYHSEYEGSLPTAQEWENIREIKVEETLLQWLTRMEAPFHLEKTASCDGGLQRVYTVDRGNGEIETITVCESVEEYP